MHTENLPSLTAEIIRKDFEIEKPLTDDIDWDGLKAWLVKEIDYLMAKRLEFMFQVLYRIDVDERKAMQVFQRAGDIADGLADLIIEREKQKVLSRLKYRQMGENF